MCTNCGKQSVGAVKWKPRRRKIVNHFIDESVDEKNLFISLKLMLVDNVKNTENLSSKQIFKLFYLVRCSTSYIQAQFTRLHR